MRDPILEVGFPLSVAATLSAIPAPSPTTAAKAERRVEACEDGQVVPVSDFHPTYEFVEQKSATGKAADFSRPDDPRELPGYDDEEHWSGRTIDGEWLADFLCDETRPKHRRGLTIIGARIADGLDLRWARVPHPLTLVSCQLGPHRIDFEEATTRSIRLRGTACGGLGAEGAEIDGSVVLDGGFSATGGVRLLDAVIVGNLECTGGLFTNGDGDALSFDRARITGGVALDQGFASIGEVRLLGASIGGNLACRAGFFTNHEGDALSFDTANIAGSVFLTDGFAAVGQVRFLDATIGGTLYCRAGTCTITSPGAGRYALAFSRARIAGGVFLDSGFSASGGVRLAGATIGGSLDCAGGTFTSPNALAALCSDGAHIVGSALLTDGFTATGEVRLLGAAINGNLDITAARFADVGRALSLDNATITGALVLGGGSNVDGTLSLSGVSAGSLADERGSWPNRIDLDGFTYRRLHGPDTDWKERAGWLRRQTTPSPAAYEQLASVYRASGDDRSARKILIERHNSLLNPPCHWKDQVTLGWPGCLQRLWRWFLRLTVGHGYEPYRIVPWLLAVLLGMTLWYADAKDHQLLVPADASGATASICEPDHICVQPFVYALDTLVPLVELRQRSEWAPDQSRHGATWYRDGRWLATATWTTGLLGWVFASLVAASFTQVVRRD
ncbi:MAG TPA: hypothetical protein VGB14_13950 [Acidimicrobiales bacterium]